MFVVFLYPRGNSALRRKEAIISVVQLNHVGRASGLPLPGIRQALAATRHLLEMYRPRLADEKTRRRLQRLDRRLLDVAVQLDRITTAEK
jgi:hypothetical protein